MENIKYKNNDIVICKNSYRVRVFDINHTIIEEFDNLNDAKDYIDAKIIIDKYMD